MDAQKEEQLAKILMEQIFLKHKVHSRIYNLTEDSFLYERFDSENKRQLYEVPYTLKEKKIIINWEKEKVKYPPSFSQPPSEVKVDI